ncbi:unnamed protein product [Arctogadus glacialis]
MCRLHGPEEGRGSEGKQVHRCVAVVQIAGVKRSTAHRTHGARGSAGCSPVARTPSSEEETLCKMGADLEADNPQALILLPCGRFPGNPFPVASDEAV